MNVPDENERIIVRHANTPNEIFRSEVEVMPNSVRVGGIWTPKGMRLVIRLSGPEVMYTADGARELARVILEAADRIEGK